MEKGIKEEPGRLEAWLNILDLRNRTHFDSHEYNRDNPEVENKLSEYNSKHGIFNISEYRIDTRGGWVKS